MEIFGIASNFTTIPPRCCPLLSVWATSSFGLENAFAHGFELLPLLSEVPTLTLCRHLLTRLQLAIGVRQVWLQGHEYFWIFFMSSISIKAGSGTS